MQQNIINFLYDHCDNLNNKHKLYYFFTGTWGAVTSTPSKYEEERRLYCATKNKEQKLLLLKQVSQAENLRLKDEDIDKVWRAIENKEQFTTVIGNWYYLKDENFE